MSTVFSGLGVDGTRRQAMKGRAGDLRDGATVLGFIWSVMGTHYGHQSAPDKFFSAGHKNGPYQGVRCVRPSGTFWSSKKEPAQNSLRAD